MSKSLQYIIQTLLIVVIIFLLYLFGSVFYTKIDLTEDGRFTLSDVTYKILEEFDDVVTISVYLEGEFPSEYKYLRTETKELLDKFNGHSEFIQYQFINPIPEGSSEERKDSIEQTLQIKSFPVSDGRQGSPIYYVYPAATIDYKGRKQVVYLLEANDIIQNQSLGTLNIRDISTVINQLEYKFTNTLRRMLYKERPRIAFLGGHGEPQLFQGTDPRTGGRMPNPYYYSFQQALFKHYDYDQINLDSTGRIDQRFNLLIIAKPLFPFKVEHQFMIDQYIMNGGNVLWLMEGVDVETDSLRGDGLHILKDRPNDLSPLLFRYGARINPELIASWEAGGLTDVQTGQMGVRTNQKWFYYPLCYPHHTPLETKQTGSPTILHPIVKDIDYVEMRYASTIDTVMTSTNVKKTFLLRSSKYSKILRPPVPISLAAIDPAIQPEAFTKGYQNTAVLLEGTFESYFTNRVPPDMIRAWQQRGRDIKFESDKSKMIVISDGDLIRNDFSPAIGRPSPLGAGWNENYGGYIYGNEMFLMNCIEYLIDDKNVMAARSREIKLRPLDKERAIQEEGYWQMLNLIMPLFILAIMGLIYNIWRNRRYRK